MVTTQAPGASRTSEVDDYQSSFFPLPERRAPPCTHPRLHHARETTFEISPSPYGRHGDRLRRSPPKLIRRGVRSHTLARAGGIICGTTGPIVCFTKSKPFKPSQYRTSFGCRQMGLGNVLTQPKQHAREDDSCALHGTESSWVTESWPLQNMVPR